MSDLVTKTTDIISLLHDSNKIQLKREILVPFYTSRRAVSLFQCVCELKLSVTKSSLVRSGPLSP